MKIANAKFLALAAALAVVLGWLAYQHYHDIERSTENAYIGADVVNVAPQVAGRVIRVYVQENQFVKKGDPLFDIDPEPYKIALAHAQADLSQALQSARRDSADIALAKAGIAQTKSDLANARSIEARDRQLVARHFLSQQSLDDAKTKVKSLEAALNEARARLESAHSAPENTADRGDYMKAQAALDQANLDLKRTHVLAEHDGQISNLTLTAGSTVGIGNPLFALIDKNSFHVDANFKETELPGIRVGQKADVEFDMYPDERFTGVVESIGGSTGTAFSLLPPQNATGNWVKITQRVPVRIRLAPMDRALRIGATATVTVHLK
jgi:membrane fusion protein, multidrug efflux system